MPVRDRRAQGKGVCNQEPPSSYVIPRADAIGVRAPCVQVPIWKKEIYEGAEAEWKANKESAAPTVAMMQANEAQRKRILMGVAVTAAIGAAVAAVRLRK